MAFDLEPVYLLSGTDRPKIERALRRLRNRVGEAAVEALSAAEASGEDAIAACNARGLFASGGRLVLVEGVEEWKPGDVDVIAAYLSEPAPETVLALVGKGIKAGSALAKACKKVGDVLFFEVASKRLPAWVAEQFKRLEANADPDACRRLVDVVGEDPHELEAEVEKLATWAAGERIDERAVELLAAGRADPSVFALTDAWGARDAAALLGACELVLERSRGPRRDEIPRILGRLVAHVARVRECQAMAAEGLSPREGAARLKRNPYYVQKLFAQAANYSRSELEDATVRLAELDLAVKGGSRLPAELELERALVDATRTNARAEALSGSR